MKCTKIFENYFASYFWYKKTQYNLQCRQKKDCIAEDKEPAFKREEKKYIYLLLLVCSVRVNFGLQKKRA